MTKLSQTLVSFSLERAMMNKALEIDGLQYTLKTNGAAVNFVGRCNQFRANLRRQRARELPEGEIAETPYDALTVKRAENVVTFEHKTLQGPLVDADGNEVELDFIEAAPETYVHESTIARIPLVRTDDEYNSDVNEAIASLGLDLT